MNGGAISGNTALGGGGVFVSDGSFTMNDGNIYGNTAIGAGGGVFVTGGSFAMNGGAISGNTALGVGGGVFLSKGSFTKTGGVITGGDLEGGNTASQSIGGYAVYVEDASGTTKRKETTSGPNDNLSFNGRADSFAGAWDD